MAEPERRPRWSLASKQDLRRIWRYYADVASREVANRLLHEISAAAAKAAHRPRLWRPRDDLGSGLRAVLVHPYVLFYRLNGDTVEVVRILHQRQNLEAELKKRSS